MIFTNIKYMNICDMSRRLLDAVSCEIVSPMINERTPNCTDYRHRNV